MKDVEVVYNPRVVQDFNSFCNKITQRQRENPSLFKIRDWTLAEDSRRKDAIYKRYEKIVNSMCTLCTLCNVCTVRTVCTVCMYSVRCVYCVYCVKCV